MGAEQGGGGTPDQDLMSAGEVGPGRGKESWKLWRYGWHAFWKSGEWKSEEGPEVEGS